VNGLPRTTNEAPRSAAQPRAPTPLPTDAVAHCAGRRERPPRRSISHTRSNICQPENVESRTCVSCLQCAAKPQSASPLFQYERQGAPRLPDCPQLCMQKSHRDRQVRRVHIGASCPPIATEHLFDFFIGRQIAPSRACFDDLPFLFADVIVRTPLFHLADEPRDLLLVVRRGLSR
jgi:hypothetical protein